MDKNIRIYLNKIETDLHRSIATEFNHLSSMETQLEIYQDNIQASSDPKYIDCGSP